MSDSMSDSTTGGGILCSMPDHKEIIMIGQDVGGDTVVEISLSDRNYRSFKVMRHFTGSNQTEKLSFLRRIRHQSFVNVYAIIPVGDIGEAVVYFDIMPIKVIDVCEQAYAELSELSIAAILGQVLQGAEFREDNDLQLARFDKFQVLADLAGNIKIRGQEWCNVGTIYPVLNGLMSFTCHVMFLGFSMVDCTAPENGRSSRRLYISGVS
ncbi:hypothetical protein HRG_008273 [Hirsutella rhossiliensis]|uniref:Uncharacterized protein n=1 Tax=Hirsutella rhossiliensis TaxID=111463 RepID=A0A9P8MTR9_9HYPO|nr:uncharacterized protein HRG_08273 [Hirsutella rhossiliensis]KAH0961120.1 hypothetical protein HRG_08273 [Hirsutella rhossiliensis]